MDKKLSKQVRSVDTNHIRRLMLLASGSASLVGLLRSAKSFAAGDPTLPAITVSASPITDPYYPGSGTLGTGEVSPLRLPPVLTNGNITGPVFKVGDFFLVNGKKILDAIERGDSTGALVEFATGLQHATEAAVRSQAAVYGLITLWLADRGYTNQPGATEYAFTNVGSMSTLFGTFSTWYFSHLPSRPATEFKFYGTPFMSIAAIYYWMFGDGSQRTMNIASLNLKMSLDDFDPIKRAVENPAYGPGTYPFDAEFSTNLFNHATKDLWAAGVIGRVGGRVTGTLEVSATGDYVFNGSFTLNPDRYKAYDSNRTITQEALTKFLGLLGTFGHKDYDILFTGGQNIQFSGKKPVAYQQPTNPGDAVHRPSFGGRQRPPR
ncbi:lipid II-degrading bacteriocin [Burkholderia sp. Z1]|uniref:lipid II-degrading bacteriocin n=1 Tax=Burkholderia sp. Z1 TaxID=2759039 RepID=UPI001868CE75|nr:lipid II-degrading bacteriocin [Burkholderia sp. Z1]